MKGAGGGWSQVGWAGGTWWSLGLENQGQQRIPICGALEGTGTCHGERKRRRGVWREPQSSSLGGAGGEGTSGLGEDEPAVSSHG